MFVLVSVVDSKRALLNFLKSLRFLSDLALWVGEYRVFMVGRSRWDPCALSSCLLVPSPSR